MMTKTIVLIHGYGFDSRIWQPVELAFDGFEVLSLSLPGFGADPVTGPYTIAELGERFWSEINADTHPLVHLVGHSMGGYVCIEMASLHPERVVSLALIHSHVFEDPSEKKLSRSEVLEKMKSSGPVDTIHKMIPSMLASSPVSANIASLLIRRGLRYHDDAWYFGTMAIRDRKDHSMTLKNMKVPVLLVLGEQDVAVPLELGLQQAHLAERTSLHVYPGVGHLSMYEKTDQLINDLDQFYKNISG
jgi:pimeloyl-ACP methyl ester carboxylesterase